MDWKRAAIAYVVLAAVLAAAQEFVPVDARRPDDWKLKLGADLILPALFIAGLWVFGRFRSKPPNE